MYSIFFVILIIFFFWFFIFSQPHPGRAEGDLVFYKCILSVGGVEVPPQVCAGNYFDGRWPGDVLPKLGASVRIRKYSDAWWCPVKCVRIDAHQRLIWRHWTPKTWFLFWRHWTPKTWFFTIFDQKFLFCHRVKEILFSCWSYLLVSWFKTWNTCVVFLPLFRV